MTSLISIGDGIIHLHLRTNADAVADGFLDRKRRRVRKGARHRRRCGRRRSFGARRRVTGVALEEEQEAGNRAGTGLDGVGNAAIRCTRGRDVRQREWSEWWLGGDGRRWYAGAAASPSASPATGAERV